MKGCSINFLINSLCEGGAERAMVTLAKEYVKNGHSVKILALAKNNFYAIPDGVEMVYLSKMDDTLSGFRKLLYFPYHAWKLKRYVKRHKIKTVHSYLFRANFVNLFSQILGSSHTIQVVNRTVISRFLSEGISGKVNMFLVRWLYQRADFIIYNSKQMQEDFNKYCKHNSKEVVIYNPFDIKNILTQADSEVNEFSFNPKKRYLIIVGRLIELKRYQDVLEALSNLPSDIELIILGDGEEQERLELAVRILSLKRRVHFLGQVKNPFKYIKRADIFISSSEVEGFPNVLVESMLCQTAVVSSDCISGPREILAPNSSHTKQLKNGLEMADFGILYAVAEVDSLTKAIKNLLEDRELTQKYREDSYKRAELFSVESIASKYQEVLCDVD